MAKNNPFDTLTTREKVHVGLGIANVITLGALTPVVITETVVNSYGLYRELTQEERKALKEQKKEMKKLRKEKNDLYRELTQEERKAWKERKTKKA